MQKKSLILGVLVLGALYILVSFGNWQVRRLAWKTALIEKLEQVSQTEPVAFSDWLGQQKEVAGVDSNWHFEFQEFAAVTVSGKLLHEQEVYVYSVRGGKTGHLIFTPLLLLERLKTKRDIGIVMVNRGFVPGKLPGNVNTKIDRPSGTVKIKGFTREIEYGGVSTPEPNRKKRQWFSNDTISMVRHLGYMRNDAPNFYIEALTYPNSKAWPIGRDPKQLARSIPNNHLGYIITWYGLALALLGVYGFFLYGQLRTPAKNKPTKEKL